MRKESVYIFLILCIIFDTYASNCYAENNFNLAPVNFWSETLPKKDITTVNALAPNKENVAQEENNLWVEPMVSPSGKLSLYMPPPQVKDFLENPNESTGMAYLEWSTKRLDKIAKAENILKNIALTNIPTTVNTFNFKDIRRITFFLLKGCPYCAQQTENILTILNKIPQSKVDVYVKNYSETELSYFPFPVKQDLTVNTSSGITKYPMTFFEDNKNNKISIPGVLSKEIINSIIN